MGWTVWARRGFSPISTPSGSQTAVASAISTTTRIMVMAPRPSATSRSCQLSRPVTVTTACQSSRPVSAATAAYQTTSPSQRRCRGAGPASPRVKRGPGQAAIRCSRRKRGLTAVFSSRARRKSRSSQDCGASAAALSSKRNLSVQAISGRKKSWS